jgi:triosephosphate isomerase
MKDFYFIAGWKMNLGVSESIDYAKQLKKYVNSISDFNKLLKIIIITDPLSIYSVAEIFRDSPINVGAPDAFWEDKGAYTGEISPYFLKRLGCNHVLVAHPERMIILKEDNKMVNKKIKAALRNEITPLLIITEKRNSDRSKIILQVRNDFLNFVNGLGIEEILKIAIIYEPLWAINTTESASSDYIDEMISVFRLFLNKEFGGNLGNRISISYGGGVNAKNFKHILNVKSIDGIGIGKASLEFGFFTKCVNLINSKLNNIETDQD